MANKGHLGLNLSALVFSKLIKTIGAFSPCNRKCTATESGNSDNKGDNFRFESLRLHSVRRVGSGKKNDKKSSYLGHQFYIPLFAVRTSQCTPNRETDVDSLPRQLFPVLRPFIFLCFSRSRPAACDIAAKERD